VKRSVTNGLVATGIAAPILAFFTGHAPPYYRELSVFITPTLGLLSLAIVRPLPKRPAIALLMSILSVAGAITLLAIYFQELQDWTVPNPAHPTIRYQTGPHDPVCLTDDGKTLAREHPNQTSAQWLLPGGYSEDNVASIWSEACRASTGKHMLLIYVLAVILWTTGNELLKHATPEQNNQRKKETPPLDPCNAETG
jgi:hypothetical protein